MPLSPITEEDRPAVERLILQCKRLRKRDVEHSGAPDHRSPYLDDAIDGLMTFGAMKGWWEYDNF